MENIELGKYNFRHIDLLDHLQNPLDSQVIHLDGKYYKAEH